MNPRILALLALALAPAAARADGPIDVGDRIEPFLDLHLVDVMPGLTHKFHRPVEITPVEQAPSGGPCATVIFVPDRKKFLHYCRQTLPGSAGSAEVTALEESADGVHWTKPTLGLFEIDGSKDNNYVLAGMPPFSHNFSPFLDTRPGCPPEQRFKALAGTSGPGVVAFFSPDGITWQKLRDEPVIAAGPGEPVFDSQTVAQWSPVEQRYVAYVCQHTEGLHSILRVTSPDFLTWTKPEPVKANLPDEQLAASQAHPYFRAPHIVVGLATRLFPEDGDLTDIVLLSSRDGTAFDRLFKEAYIRPEPLDESWGSRGNEAAINVFPLKNTADQLPEEWRFALSKRMGIMVRDRIYALRNDGFASVNAGYEPGELVTKPLVFSGDELRVNYATSASGFMQVEILDADGRPIAGYTRADYKDRLWGNNTEERAQWTPKGTDVSGLKGKTVRLKFFMREADLYAIQFRKLPK